jgi:hypothetical protein
MARRGLRGCQLQNNTFKTAGRGAELPDDVNNLHPRTHLNDRRNRQVPAQKHKGASPIYGTQLPSRPAHSTLNARQAETLCWKVHYNRYFGGRTITATVDRIFAYFGLTQTD